MDQLAEAASFRFEQLERAQQPATKHATSQSLKPLKEHFSSLKHSWTQSEVRDTFLDGRPPSSRLCLHKPGAGRYTANALLSGSVCWYRSTARFPLMSVD